MISIEPLFALLLVALPVFGSGITLDYFDTVQGLGLETRAGTRVIDVDNGAKRTDERRLLHKDTVLGKGLTPLTASTSTPVSPRDLPDIQSHRNKERDKEDICNKDLLPRQRFSSFSADLSSSIFNSLSISSVSVLASIKDDFSASLRNAQQNASEEGFQDGQSQASESAQSLCDALKASASSVVENSCSAAGNIITTVETTVSVVETVLSTVEGATHTSESISSTAGDLNKASRDLNLDAGQFAGIIVGVFFLSSILSVLATLFLLRYRRQRMDDTRDARPQPVEAKRQTIWPTLGKLRGSRLPPGPWATGRHGVPAEPTPGPKRWVPSQSQQGIPSTNRTPMASSVSPGSSNIFPVSPLSDRPSTDLERDSGSSLGLGLHGSRTQITSGPEVSEIPPPVSSIGRNRIHDGSWQIPIVHVEEVTAHPLRSNAWATETLQSDNGPAASTAPHEDYNTRIQRETPALAPGTSKNALIPPTIPLRFSSLNAYKGPPIQSSVGFHGDETFLLSTDDESGDRDLEPSQEQSGHQSPSHSSIISQDPTQFDPEGLTQQPTSRFSMSSAPLSSLEYSASSSSPVPPLHEQQQEHPEISPLRPAPPNPAQLQSPMPTRPSLTPDVASLEPPSSG
ncbi:hypothetical protein NUW58_g6754 [Xylaria curta]|uniref:Uncharacterized protein n=1 Tax=Xylaria curta TaxID=42375 RepID=A0ACC1NPI0_9PEZI|nr:hypothetical protein NUW58_g6754 [Xylaria curta]